nr:hypothetical protein Iba_chr01bCG14580 [Ipomoea batatas]
MEGKISQRLSIIPELQITYVRFCGYILMEIGKEGDTFVRVMRSPVGPLYSIHQDIPQNSYNLNISFHFLEFHLKNLLLIVFNQGQESSIAVVKGKRSDGAFVPLTCLKENTYVKCSEKASGVLFADGKNSIRLSSILPRLQIEIKSSTLFSIKYSLKKSVMNERTIPFATRLSLSNGWNTVSGGRPDNF